MLTPTPEDYLEVIHHLRQGVSGNGARITDIAARLR